MSPLIKLALAKAYEVRKQFGLDLFQPTNVFDICDDLGLTVWFVDINMEGMYKSDGQIVLSSLRPLSRRVYTCAHELGHHLFNHGTKIDELNDSDNAPYDNDELLVDAFAGALLMPIAGVQAEFAKRNLKPNSSTPLQFYIISSVFGTGYQSLVTHCKVNKLITNTKAASLQKHTPAKILKEILGKDTKASFKIFDGLTHVPVIDIEVSNVIFLPKSFKIEGNHLEKLTDTNEGVAYIAQKAGIIRAYCPDDNTYFIRIQNIGYIGLSENRHLEN